MPPPLPTPVQPLVDNGGYIYAPSSEQAAVAAVLALKLTLPPWACTVWLTRN